MRFASTTLSAVAFFASLGQGQLSGQQQGLTAIGDPLFSDLKCAAGVGYTYSAKGCTKEYINDRCGVQWQQLGTYNMSDTNGGSIIVRWFRKPATKELFVFFPGTDNSYSNWQTNFDLELVSYTFGGRCADCKIHKGFLRVFEQNRNSIIYLSSIWKNSKYPDHSFSLIGGSLGGALASLFYADWTINTNLGLVPGRGVSFGQPRTGNVQYAALMNGLTNANQGKSAKWLRVTHSYDSIPQLPNNPGYYHHSGEIWAEDRPGFPPRPDKDSTWVCPQGGFGSEPAKCVNDPAHNDNLLDHTTYPGYEYNNENAVC